MITTYKGQEIELDDISHGEDPCDSFAQAGWYVNSLKDLTDAELDAVNNNTDFTEEWYEHQIGRAEYYNED